MQISIHRIWLLIRKQWSENQQLYLLGMLATAGIMAAITAFNVASNNGLEEHTQEFIIFIGVIVAGSIFSTTILSQFNDKSKGIQALTLPASILEKYLVAMIYSMVLFPLVFIIVVYPIILIGHQIDTTILGRSNSAFILKRDEDALGMFATFIVVQTMALFCSVLFRRYIFIKAVILIIVIVFGVNLLNPIIARTMLNLKKTTLTEINVKEIIFDEYQKPIDTATIKQLVPLKIENAAPYSELSVHYGGSAKAFKGARYAGFQTVLRNNYNTAFFILLALMIPFLWVITWFKLKEKEL